FQLYGKTFGSKIDPYYARHAFRVLKYVLPVPESGAPTLVNIEFRQLMEDSAPFESRTVRGRRIEHTIHLEERFVAFFPFLMGCGTCDIYCRLIVDDLEVYSYKMKRDRFEELGLQFEELS